MATLRPIAQLGDPVLRHVAEPIYSVQADWVQLLIADLMATLRHSNGVGIAAPQVAVSRRLIIIASHPNNRYPHAPKMAPTPMINPQILQRSAKKLKDWEGCLSIPGIRGLVPRHESVEIAYTDCTGKLQYQHLTGFVARIFQHEFDHLEGKVFLDHVESTSDFMTDQEYLKQFAPQVA